MESSQGSLLESLGSIGNFVNNSPALYGIDEFLSYIESIKLEMGKEVKNSEARAIIHATGSKEDSIVDAIELLIPKLNLWKKMNYEEEEE